MVVFWRPGLIERFSIIQRTIRKRFLCECSEPSQRKESAQRCSETRRQSVSNEIVCLSMLSEPTARSISMCNPEAHVLHIETERPSQSRPSSAKYILNEQKLHSSKWRLTRCCACRHAYASMDTEHNCLSTTGGGVSCGPDIANHLTA